MTFTAAKRGDVVIAVKTSKVYAIHTGIRHVTRITVGTAHSVSRQGEVKKIAVAGSDTLLSPRDWDNVLVLSKGRITDMPALLDACAARQDLSPHKYNPWLDLADVKNTLKQFVRD